MMYNAPHGYNANGPRVMRYSGYQPALPPPVANLGFLQPWQQFNGGPLLGQPALNFAQPNPPFYGGPIGGQFNGGTPIIGRPAGFSGPPRDAQALRDLDYVRKNRPDLIDAVRIHNPGQSPAVGQPAGVLHSSGFPPAFVGQGVANPPVNYLPQPMPTSPHPSSPVIPISPSPSFQSYAGVPSQDKRGVIVNPQSQASLDPDDPQRKNLYSLYSFSSNQSGAINSGPIKVNKIPDTSNIFYEYHSDSSGKVSPQDFLANVYGVDSSLTNNAPNNLVKICKMVLSEPINIGDCTIEGRRNFIDINDKESKTRIHIDDEGAKALEDYKILIRIVIDVHKNHYDFSSISQDNFKNLKNISDIRKLLNDNLTHPLPQQNDEKTLDAFVDTFISNNLKAGRFKTQKQQPDGSFNDEPFAYVRIERPNNSPKINVTVSDKFSEKLSNININAGTTEGKEVFFQIKSENINDKNVIKKDSLKYFTKEGIKFNNVELKKSWLGKLKTNELGTANQKIINIYSHKEKDTELTLKHKIKDGKFHKDWTRDDSKASRKHENQKVKCGEPDDFNAQSLSALQANPVPVSRGMAAHSPPPPAAVQGGGVGVVGVGAPMPLQVNGAGVLNSQPPYSPIPMMGAPAPMGMPMPQMPMPAPMPMSPQPPPAMQIVRVHEGMGVARGMQMGGGQPIPGGPPAMNLLPGGGMQAPMPMPGGMPMMGGGVVNIRRVQPPMVVPMMGAHGGQQQPIYAGGPPAMNLMHPGFHPHPLPAPRIMPGGVMPAFHGGYGVHR